MTTTEQNGRKSQNTQELMSMIWDIRHNQRELREQMSDITEAVKSIRRAAVLVTIFIVCHFLYWFVEVAHWAVTQDIEQY